MMVFQLLLVQVHGLVALLTKAVTSLTVHQMVEQTLVMVLVAVQVTHLKHGQQDTVNGLVEHHQTHFQVICG
jgi:hypothetical protein